MSKFVSLAQQLDTIPHLDLKRHYDVDRLHAELDTLDPTIFVPYRSVSKRHRDMVARSWEGFSLISSDGSLHSDLSEEYFAAPPTFDWTAVADQVPYLKEIVTDLGGAGQRARVMRVLPGGRIAWHRHGGEPSTSGESGRFTGVALRPNWYELIVHIPLRTNPDFSYEVVDVTAYQSCDFLTETLPVHRACYPEGQAWGFNSTHVHNVFNRSATETRYALMLNLDLRMKRTYEAVAPAVAAYDGPRLPPV